LGAAALEAGRAGRARDVAEAVAELDLALEPEPATLARVALSLRVQEVARHREAGGGLAVGAEPGPRLHGRQLSDHLRERELRFLIDLEGRADRRQHRPALEAAPDPARQRERTVLDLVDHAQAHPRAHVPGAERDHAGPEQEPDAPGHLDRGLGPGVEPAAAEARLEHARVGALRELLHEGGVLPLGTEGRDDGVDDPDHAEEEEQDGKDPSHASSPSERARRRSWWSRGFLQAWIGPRRRRLDGSRSRARELGHEAAGFSPHPESSRIVPAARNQSSKRGGAGSPRARWTART